MLRRILDVLVEAVTRGAVEVLTLKRTGTMGARYKDAKELVTAADERSDAAIRSVFETQLLAIDPTSSLHLEESGATGASHLKKAGADPLDGTNHFASGGNLYSGDGSLCRGRSATDRSGFPTGGLSAVGGIRNLHRQDGACDSRRGSLRPANRVHRGYFHSPPSSPGQKKKGTGYENLGCLRAVEH